MMAFSVMISLFVGLVVGCASMALWAARRIGDEAARQFDRGFERGRWLADVSTTGGLEPVGRTRRILIVPGAPPDADGADVPDPCCGHSGSAPPSLGHTPSPITDPGLLAGRAGPGGAGPRAGHPRLRRRGPRG